LRFASSLQCSWQCSRRRGGAHSVSCGCELPPSTTMLRTMAPVGAVVGCCASKVPFAKGRAGQGRTGQTKDVSRSRRRASESENGSGDGPSRLCGRCRGTFSGIGQHGGQYVVAMHPGELFEPFSAKSRTSRWTDTETAHPHRMDYAIFKLYRTTSLPAARIAIAPHRARAPHLLSFAHAAHPATCHLLRLPTDVLLVSTAARRSLIAFL
jgi:hypothetical protein